MLCKYCGERDESRLMISSRLVNGKVETIDICFKCFWIDKFKAEGENGILPERETIEGIESVRSINLLNPRERV